MKINRNPVPEITEEMVKQDHEFWSQYSKRLIGNWITYDTPVSNICEFAERVYLQRDYSGFQGDPKFVRDDNAQKAFSKLRSSIGGVYSWRVNNSKSPVEQQRMVREAEFSLRQAFAFCPYSPEAVYRYVNLLASFGRLSDAALIARTCLKLDPYNIQVRQLVNQLDSFERGRPEFEQARQQLGLLEESWRANPQNLTAGFQLAQVYLQLQQTNSAFQLFNHLTTNANSDANLLLNIAQVYANLGNASRLETIMVRLVQMMPENAEVWYDLATIQATLGQQAQAENRQNEAVAKYRAAIVSLAKAVELSNKRRATQPTAKNLGESATQDPRFNPLRALPEFQRIFAP